ncbi:hypothetical protein, partial [uncultured Maribacter sp.]|uniref:hypothetical protein n=1 Tax=uncultured Maribacter sp. TaxID=431308 RepID=UPI00260B7122
EVDAFVSNNGYLTSFSEVDGDITNETITAFGINGANLRITEAGTNFDVPLSSLGSDNQNDSEVPLAINIDVDDDEKTVAQGFAEETTVQEVIQAIAPITSKAARIFYPPSIAVDASTNGTGRTINLYTQYTAQYGSPMVVSGTGASQAPAAIPTYDNTELYYYITYYDTSVFANVSVNEFGVMTYDVINQPVDYNSLINVVFVVK